MDEVAICNMAIAHLGVDRQIESLEETSKDAINCKLFYEQARDEALRVFPWQFAMKFVVLGEVDPDTEDLPPGWSHMYNHPTDCLFARAVCDEGGIRSIISLPDHCWTGQLKMLNRRYPFSISANEALTSKMILTDLEEARLIYTARVADCNMFDPLFTAYLSRHLSAYIAMPITSKPAIADRCAQLAMMALSRAGAQNMNESGADPLPESPSISVRQ